MPQMPNSDGFWTLLLLLFNAGKYLGTWTCMQYLQRQESWDLIRDVFSASCFLFTNNMNWEVEEAAGLFKAD